MKNKELLKAIKVGQMIFESSDINIESKMTTKEFLKRFRELQDEAYSTLVKKNKDYAGVGDPFKNFRLVEQLGICSVEKGILVRKCDKLSRISTLIDKEASVTDEKILDTLMDDSNYALILRVYLENK